MANLQLRQLGLAKDFVGTLRTCLFLLTDGLLGPEAPLYEARETTIELHQRQCSGLLSEYDL